MSRLDIHRQRKLEPLRMATAKQKIEALGYHINTETPTEIHFDYKGRCVKFFPYSGWHTGATIQDGRGLENLLKQLKP